MALRVAPLVGRHEALSSAPSVFEASLRERSWKAYAQAMPSHGLTRAASPHHLALVLEPCPVGRSWMELQNSRQQRDCLCSWRPHPLADPSWRSRLFALGSLKPTEAFWLRASYQRKPLSYTAEFLWLRLIRWLTLRQPQRSRRRIEFFEMSCHHHRSRATQIIHGGSASQLATSSEVRRVSSPALCSLLTP